MVGCLTLGDRNVPRYNGTQHRCGPRSRMMSLARSGIHREMASERLVVMWPGVGTWQLALTSHCSMAGQGRASLCSSQALTAVIAVTAGPCLPGSVVTNYSNYSNNNIRIVLFSIWYSILFINRIYSVFGIQTLLKNLIYSVFGQF